MKTACLTVFYPGMEAFLADFLESVKTQTCTNFDLLVINDGSSIDKQTIQRNINQKIIWYDFQDTPQKNRIYGLQKCVELDYDAVICADADETMHKYRIKKVTEYLQAHPEVPVVFNNSVAEKGGTKFDLFYKDKIHWKDILDFNVLGYGAMNLQGKGMELIASLENENVQAFDWYAGFIFSLYFNKIHFLKEAVNHYRFHDDNFVGPVFKISQKRVKQALKVKKNLYDNLAVYTVDKGFLEVHKKLNLKLNQLDKTNNFITQNGFDAYFEQVKKALGKETKLYWWQEGILL